MNEIIKVSWNKINTIKIWWEDYISLTDIAKEKNIEFPADIIKNWMRTKSTVSFLWLWEKLYNNNFKLVEYDQFKIQAWENSFVLSPKKWIETTNAIWLVSKSWRYDWWTFAHKDIAFEFASWISPEFKLYLIKEFQRLKEVEQRRLDPEWNVNRILSKVNYQLHTDSIKENLIDWKIIDKKLQWIKYADEADLLNVVIFWKTNKQWREESWISSKKKNIREYASIEELLVLSNIEYLNSKLINDWLEQKERFEILSKEASKQLENILKNRSIKKLK